MRLRPPEANRNSFKITRGRSEVSSGLSVPSCYDHYCIATIGWLPVGSGSKAELNAPFGAPFGAPLGAPFGAPFGAPPAGANMDVEDDDTWQAAGLELHCYTLLYYYTTTILLLYYYETTTLRWALSATPPTPLPPTHRHAPGA